MVVEDPAAVAARESRKKDIERKLLIVVGAGVGLAGLVYARNFIRETQQAMELANRPKKRWEI